MKNIFDYTNTEINKMRRVELLKLQYERDKFYMERINGSKTNWSKEHTFDEYRERHKHFTVKELRESLKLR